LEIAQSEANEICEEDIKFCKNIGLNGLKIIEKIYNNFFFINISQLFFKQ